MNVRKFGTGTCVNNVWRLKEKKDKEGRTVRPNLSMSVAQLSALFKVPLRGKGDSEKYWLRFLKAHANYTAKKQGLDSPLQERIRSLEVLIATFKDEKRPAEVVALLERELAEARAVPAHDIDHSDGPAIHPDVRPQAELLDASGHLDDFTARLLNSMAPKPIPQHESLKAEIDSYVEREKQKCLKLRKRGKQGKHYHMVKQYLDLFFQVTGHIRVRDITRQHYQEFVAGVDGSSKTYLWNVDEKRWGKTTQANIQQQLHAFLLHLEIEYDPLSFPFIRNPKTRIKRTDGKKTNWSLEQVQTALKHATGDARLMLLCGLNFGFYIDDVKELDAAHYDGTHVHKGRSKNEGKSDFVGSWWVWPETAEVLAYGRPKTALYEAFKKLRKEHELPEHSDLRKTVSQWIENAIELAGGEQVARLYRCEKAKGNHGRYYSRCMTPEQRDALDKALRFVRAKLFG